MGTRVNFWNRVWLFPYNGKGCWIWIGPVHSQGYGTHGKHLAHRKAYEELVGPIPPGMDLDHRCFERLCVNPKHLRVASRKQNMENHQGARSDSKSGVRGVYWEPRASAWRAQVKHGTKKIHVGYFKSLEEADQAVTEKRNELFTLNDYDRETH